MAKKWVCCLAENGTQACRIIERLQTAGFSSNHISVLLPDKERTLESTQQKETKAPQGAVTGAALGGILGLLTGLGALVIPGVGPFVAAGPIIAALGGVAAGSMAGGLVGTLIGSGIPEDEAQMFEKGLREGRNLLAVYSENSDEISCATAIFERAGAQAISSSCEKLISDAQPHHKAA
jgi:hypothetical protein